MIRNRVKKTNQRLVKDKLVIKTWGNASAIDNSRKNIYIKPSGVKFEDLTEENIVKLSLKNKSYNEFKPSVDTPTHIELYKHFKDIGGVVHTHSRYSTIFAQSKRSIPCLGTTHADYFKGDIPIIEDLTKEEIVNNYEKNIGLKIVKYFKKNDISYKTTPGVLVPSHGVFTWGSTIEKALDNAIVLEEVSKLAYGTIRLINTSSNSSVRDIMDKNLLEKHFSRMNSKTKKYYGQ